MYRWLLRLYPASFRHEYGDEMRRVFAQQRREARSPAARCALWMRVIVDMFVNAARVQWDVSSQDVRYVARTFVRKPAFACTALILISLGVGATTAAFTVTDFVLLRALPFPQAERLVTVWEQRPGYRLELSPANYRDWKRMATSFEAFGAYRGLSGNLAGTTQPQRVEGAVLTADLLPALGVSPLIGRWFSDDDDRDGAARVLLLSFGLWQREFAGNTSVVGSTVRLDGLPYVVVGVMPREFHFPTHGAEMWTPMRFDPREFSDRNDNYLNVVARLRPGTSLQAARTEMNLLAAQLKQQYPKENEHTGAEVRLLRDDVSQQSRMLLFAVLGASACLLLIACANLANLLLARATSRRRELAIRLALGAGRERILRQLVTENLLLAAVGGACGVGVAAMLVPALAQLVPSSLPIAALPAIDLRILAFTAGLTVVTAIAFGLVPLAHQARDRANALRDDARAGGGQRERLRGTLVIAEIAISIVLLVSCGLLLRAVWNIRQIDPGFRREHTLTARTPLPMPKYEQTATRTAFYTRVLSDIHALPGVSDAAFISFLPMSDMRGGIFPVGIGSVAGDRREKQVAFLRYVTPGFFRTMGIPLRLGRDVSEADTNDRQAVAVVSESFVRQFFPGQDVIGHRFNFVAGDRAIVGVVGDVKVRGITRNSEPQVYLPYQQVADGNLIWYSPKDLVVRTAGDPLAIVSMVRAIVQRADAELPLSDVRTLEALVEGETASRTTQVRVLGAFALIAVLLGGFGVHGLLAFVVSLRQMEMGVRMALGATRFNIVSMVLRRSLMLAAIGIVCGVALAYMAGRAVQSLLVGVAPLDALTFTTAVGLSLAMTLVGSLRPAVRAARVDPRIAMRPD